MAERNSHVSGFVGQIQFKFRPEQPDTFWDCEAPFRSLLQSGFLSEVLNEHLARLAREPDAVSDILATELVLHRGGGLALSVSVLEEPHRYIHSLAYHGMCSVVGHSNLSFNTYELPAGFRNQVFDPSLKLQPASSGSLKPGEVLCMRSGKYAYDFLAERPTPIVKFMTTAIDPLEWLFTRTGLQAWQANDADLSYTQLRVAADVVGKFAHQSSLEPLKRLTHHPHHAVRWAAIQNLARLSRSEAIARLRHAAIDDPHPHIQRAAKKSLDKLQAG
jgi:hypothetical protein